MSLDRPVEPCGDLLRSVTATDTVRPWTTNSERANHWRAHRKLTKDARDRWAWLWREAGAHRLRFERCDVTVQPSYKGHPADTGACAGSAKAAVDAAVDVGLLATDTGKVIRSVTFLAPLSGVDGLTVTVTEVQS